MTSTPEAMSVNDAFMVVREPLDAARFRLTDADSEQLMRTLAEGYRKALTEDRREDFARSVHQLSEAVFEAAHRAEVEPSMDSPSEKPPLRHLPPEFFSWSLRSICPLWPFC
jgi:hypothetical protein